MTKELPAEISRFNRELVDFESKIIQSEPKPGKMNKARQDHNCNFPVRRCYCGDGDYEVRRTQVRHGRNSLPARDLSKGKNAKRNASEERNQRRTQNARVYKTDISPSKSNRLKGVYDVENARVTVEVTRDRSHSPPKNYKRTQTRTFNDDHRSSPEKTKSRRWAEILTDQNNPPKISSTKSTQYEENVHNRDDLTSEASTLLNRLNKKSSCDKHELKTLVMKLETILKQLEKKTNIDHEIERPESNYYNKNMENMKQKWEMSCKQFEESCWRLKKERDSIREELIEKNDELKKANLREMDLKAKLSEANFSVEVMSKKIDRYSESTKELASKFSQIQDEKKELGKLQKQVSEMSDELKTVSMDRNSLKTELELVKLERDKLRVLLTMKDQEIARMKKEIMKIGDNVTRRDKGDFSNLDLSGISKSSHFVCSSPNTTSSEEDPIAKSWKKLSTIVPSDAEQSLHEEPVTKKEKAKKVSQLFTNVVALGDTSPERLDVLKKDLKGLFTKMKRQAEIVIEHDNAAMRSDSVDLINTPSWTRLSGSSHSQSDMADMSDSC